MAKTVWKERTRTRSGQPLGWKIKFVDVDGRGRSRSFADEMDANEFQHELLKLHRAGRAPTGKTTLAQFMAKWWDAYAVRELSERTQNTYAAVWNQFMPYLGGLPMDRLTPKVFDDFKRDALDDGHGVTTVAKALQICQAALRQAEIWGDIDRNPVPVVRKPTAPRRLVVLPTMEQVELVRAVLAGEGRRNSATLVAVLAYAGLRPEEARALRWADIGKNTILVHRKCEPDGEVVAGSKTDRRWRTVDLLAPLAADLAEWRLAQGRPDTEQLVFPKAGVADPGYGWTDSDFRNWRSRIYRPAATQYGLPEPGRPYALRHAFASLLLYAHAHTEVARQLGHSPSMLLDTYGHVIGELRETRGPVDPAAAIYAAREAATERRAAA